MKKKVLFLLTLFTLVCFVGCSSNEQATAGDNKQDISAVEPTKEAKTEVTTEPSSEPEAEVTEETTPEATEEPIVYEGIDMESTLPGEQWIMTFVGVIDEPKIVVFSDGTGRKEIIKEGTKVPINPDEDVIAIYLPEGYKFANKTKGISATEVTDAESYKAFYLDSEKTREKKFKEVAIYVDHGEEEISLGFTLKSE